MIRPDLDWKKSLIPGLAPIRAYRQKISMRIEVCAFDRGGRFFTELTETSDVSTSGCKCHLRTEISGDAILAIRILNDSGGRAEFRNPVLFRAVRMERASGGWMVGASKLQQNDAWLANLPAIEARQSSKFA